MVVVRKSQVHYIADRYAMQFTRQSSISFWTNRFGLLTWTEYVDDFVKYFCIPFVFIGFVDDVNVKRLNRIWKVAFKIPFSAVEVRPFVQQDNWNPNNADVMSN